MDVAASGFSEQTTIFGGAENLNTGLRNVMQQYHPGLIGIASTCLAETIGENLEMLVGEFSRNEPDHPPLLHASTPSYKGTHVDGFHAVVRAAVEALAAPGEPEQRINVFPGMVSPADLRFLKEVISDFDLAYTLLPDYSDTLDGPQLEEYEKIPAGGASIETIRKCGSARASLEFGRTLTATRTAAEDLEIRCGVPRRTIGWPVGVRESDVFLDHLSTISGRPIPEKHKAERGRLVDSYVDGHKYLFGRRAIVYGEEDLVVGLAAFLSETGIQPVLCASGGRSGLLARAVEAVTGELAAEITVRQDKDFLDILEQARQLEPDFLIGSSKGHFIARELDVPLIRVGFPIHDRIGGQRVLHLGYRGAQQLFDAIANVLIARAQDRSPVGYSYM